MNQWQNENPGAKIRLKAKGGCNKLYSHPKGENKAIELLCLQVQLLLTLIALLGLLM